MEARKKIGEATTIDTETGELIAKSNIWGKIFNSKNTKWGVVFFYPPSNILNTPPGENWVKLLKEHNKESKYKFLFKAGLDGKVQTFIAKPYDIQTMDDIIHNMDGLEFTKNKYKFTIKINNKFDEIQRKYVIEKL